MNHLLGHALPLRYGFDPQPSILPSTSNPKILVIDNDSFIRTQLKSWLQKDAYVVIETQTAEEGIRAYEARSPNIVLLDAFMPKMSGFECCTHLKTLPHAAKTPILMTASLDDETSVNHAFEVGATDFISKPIHWPILRQRLRRFLEWQATRVEVEQAQAHLEKMNEELQRLASLDGLTHVANRRFFDMQLEKEWKRMQREQQPLSCILCDIDFFKAYNDNLGHQAGDRCLKQVANIIALAAKRPADVVARYGGEEFVLLLPATSLSGAVELAKSIQSQLRRATFLHPHSPVSPWVTVSLGIASQVPQPGHCPEDLLAKADKALYQAKKGGRNGFKVFDETIQWAG